MTRGERRLSQLQEQSSRLSAFEGRLRIRAGENMAMTTTAILVLSLGMLLLAQVYMPSDSLTGFHC